MPAVLNMTAIPGHLEKSMGCTIKHLEIIGREYGRESKIIGTVADARQAIAAFGARIKADHPDTSFYVSATVRKGTRKPRGYDDADRNDGLGQAAFLVLREPEAA